MNLVFDFGAVLFDWRPAHVIARYFPEHDHAALGKSVFSHPDWVAFDAGLCSPEEVIAQTAARTGLDRDALTQMVAEIPDGLLPIESSIQVLQHIAQQRQAFSLRSISYLSNMPEPYARVLESRHDFLQLFDSGIFSGDVKLAKPDPAIYALTEERLQAKPGSILFIDDHPDNIAAARIAGWQTLHLTDPSKLPEQLLGQLGKSMP
jgi:putative hydrolase of the HAD superfamily